MTACVLEQSAYETWLSPETSPDQTRELLLHPYMGPFEVRNVSRRVNSARNDDPELIEAT